MLAEDEQAFRKWLTTYGKHVENREVDALTTLFSPDVVFHLSPFDAPLRGSQAVGGYFRQTLGARESIKFTGEVIKSASDACWAHWACGFIRSGTDDPVRQEGVMKVTFDSAGACMTLQQWWNSIEPGQSELMRDTDA